MLDGFFFSLYILYIYIQVCTKVSISTSSQHIELVDLLFLVHVQPQNEVLGFKWLNTKYGSYFISAPYCKQIFSNVFLVTVLYPKEKIFDKNRDGDRMVLTTGLEVRLMKLLVSCHGLSSCV